MIPPCWWWMWQEGSVMESVQGGISSTFKCLLKQSCCSRCQSKQLLSHQWAGLCRWIKCLMDGVMPLKGQLIAILIMLGSLLMLLVRPQRLAGCTCSRWWCVLCFPSYLRSVPSVCTVRRPKLVSELREKKNVIKSFRLEPGVNQLSCRLHIVSPLRRSAMTHERAPG